MEPEAQEVTIALAGPVAPAVDELLAELRDHPPEQPLAPAVVAQLFKLELSLDDAYLLYEILRKKVGSKPSQGTAISDPKMPRSDLAKLFKLLEDRLREVSSTAKKSTRIVLELQPLEARFLRKIVKNKKIDNARREKTYNKHFDSLDATAEESTDEDDDEEDNTSSFEPSNSMTPETELIQAETKQALAEMPAELAVLIPVLQEVDGNVSELARRLGQPQRKTARQIERLRKYLLKRGLGPV
jgi:hypothetical protein